MKSNNAAGLMFALLGYIFLATGDGFIKSISKDWPGPAIGALRYSIGALGLVPLLLYREGAQPLKSINWRIHWMRGAAVAVATASFFTALTFIPLAEATVITFLSPLFAALFSSVFLKEKPPKAALSASAIAFVGVVMVMRPSFQNVGAAALFPMLGAAGMGALLVLNRRTAGTGSVIMMQALISITGASILILISAVAHYFGWLKISWPSTKVMAVCGIVAVTATFAHSFIYMATTRASAALVAPMTYVQLLVALTISYFAFGTFPDAMALTGSALIVAGGLFLWWQS